MRGCSCRNSHVPGTVSQRQSSSSPAGLAGPPRELAEHKLPHNAGLVCLENTGGPGHVAQGVVAAAEGNLDSPVHAGTFAADGASSTAIFSRVVNRNSQRRHSRRRRTARSPTGRLS
jgi:hypothetical protein